MAGRRRSRSRGESRRPPGPRRVLSADERQRLTFDAWDLVTFLQEVGLVRPDELEDALLLVTALDAGEVDALDMVCVLSSVIQDRERVAMILGGGQAGRLEEGGLEDDDDGDDDDDDDGTGPEPRLLH